MATGTFKAIFTIAENIKCPLYVQGEKMELTDRTFSCPEGKEVCLILVRDMTQLLFTLIKAPESGAGKVFSCSGCTGLIKFRQVDAADDAGEIGSQERVQAHIHSVMQEVHGRSVESAFLKVLPADKVDAVIRSFQEVRVPKGKLLIHQGEPNPNIYLIMSGSFAVESNRQKISSLGTGELFGEMSYLGTEPAVASIRALEESLVLAIRADGFSRLLTSSPEVQGFMARLLAQRLQQINMIRTRDFESSMSGRFADVMPAELLQVFNMHQKTGRLLMDLPGGKARIAFREGAMVAAQYRGRSGEEAIYAVLAEKRGFYRFTSGLTEQDKGAAEIGDFMAILMEGIKRVDEDDPELGDDYTEE